MKKSLVALAVLAATGAFAQSSVTLYGRMDLGTSGGNVETTSAATLAAPNGVASTVRLTELAGAQNVWTGSRLGVRGSEDLGGGLKANFQVETRIDPDATTTGSTTFGRTRLALLQVAGGFGSVTIGTYYNPFDDIRTSAGTGGVAGGWTLDRINTARLGLDSRSTNSIGYRTPVFGGGFVASIGTTYQKADSGLNSAGNLVAAQNNGYIGSVGYMNGPISVLAAYGIGNQKASIAAVGLVPATSVEGRVNDFGLKASYNLGIAVPYIQYENTRRTNKNIIANTNDNVTSRGFEIGSTFPMGAFTPYIVYAINKQTPGAGNQVVKTNAFQLGSKYDLSKRTFVYGAFGRHIDKIENTTSRTRATGYGLGLVHNF